MRDFFKKIIPYYKPYKYRILFGLLFVVFANAAKAFRPWVLRLGVNAIEDGVVPEKLWSYAGYLILVAAISGAFTLLMRLFIVGASRYVEYDLRHSVMQHFFKLQPAFYDHAKIGDLMTRITSDVEQVRMVLGPALMYTVNTIFGFLFSLSFMAMISPKLTVIVLFIGPVISYMVFLISKRIHVASHQSQQAFADVSAVVQENISGIRVVKAFRQENAQEERFDGKSDRLLRKNMRLILLRSIFFPAVMSIFGLAVGAILLAGGYQIIQGSLRIGDFVAFVSYLMMLTWPMVSTGWVISLYQRGKASFDRIEDVLNSELDEDIAPINEAQILERGTVRVENLKFKYPKTNVPVLRDISFTLKEGMTLGIVGRVGSGKSSIASVLTKQYPYSSGLVIIDGFESSKWNKAQLREHLSLVPQEPLLFSATIRENITLGTTYSEEQVKHALEASQLVQDLEDFPDGLETEVGERGITLSGGQKQRVAIARAIIREPEIIIFDDALSAVDTATEEKIVENLNLYMKNRTSIIITHRISSVMNADEILVLDEGKIVERGTHVELTALKGAYSEIFQQQRMAEELEDVI